MAAAVVLVPHRIGADRAHWGGSGCEGAKVSRRNLVWLAAIIVVAVVVWIAAGWLWGVLAGVATLVVSEVVERGARRRRIAERGGEAPSVRGTVDARRKRR